MLFILYIELTKLNYFFKKVIKEEPIKPVDKNDIYPSVPLKDVGKRKRNDASVIDLDTKDSRQPSKKFKIETSTEIHKDGKKQKPSTIVSNNGTSTSTSTNHSISECDDTNDNNSSASAQQKDANANNNKPMQLISNKKMKKKKRNSYGGGDKTKVGQPSNKPVAFDYSTVDFKKFQGGSKKNLTKNDVETKFHGKVS